MQDATRFFALGMVVLCLAPAAGARLWLGTADPVYLGLSGAACLQLGLNLLLLMASTNLKPRLHLLVLLFHVSAGLVELSRAEFSGKTRFKVNSKLTTMTTSS